MFIVFPLAVCGAVAGIFVDTSGQRRLFLGAMAMVTLLSLFAILATHTSVLAGRQIFDFEAPQHVWDFNTLFVYSYQLLYMGLFVGATAIVLRHPAWAAQVMMAAVSLLFIESFYREFVDYYAFLPTHIVLIHEEIEVVPLGEMIDDTATSTVIDFTMGHTLEVVAFAIALALAAMVRNKGATEEGTNEG